MNAGLGMVARDMMSVASASRLWPWMAGTSPAMTRMSKLLRAEMLDGGQMKLRGQAAWVVTEPRQKLRVICAIAEMQGAIVVCDTGAGVRATVQVLGPDMRDHVVMAGQPWR